MTSANGDPFWTALFDVGTLAVEDVDEPAGDLLVSCHLELELQTYK